MGRAVSIGLGAVGVDTVLPLQLEDGSVVVVDTRGRTESSAVWTGTYDPDLLAYLDAAATVTNFNFIDVGANVGLLSIPLARRAEPLGGTVLAIEPIAANARRLRRSIVLNGLKNVDVLEAAVGDQPGTVSMTRESAFGQTSGNAIIAAASASRPPRGETSYEVPVRTLDDVVAGTKTAWGVVKIDCEGYDVRVIQGAAQFLNAQRPIVWGEFHTGLTPRHGPRFGSLGPLLDSLRYDAFSFADIYDLRPEVPQDNIGNCTLVPRELVTRLLDELARRKGT